MAANRFRAVAISLAVAIAPFSVAQAVASGQGVAVQASEVTPEALQALISEAAAAAQQQPGFANLSAAQQLAAIQASVANALAESGASPRMIANALIAAVGSGTITAGVAVQVAAAAAPTMAATVAQSPIVQASLTPGQTVSVTQTASTSGGAPSVLISLQSAATPGGSAPVTVTVTAPFDPCAGASGPYCG
jgi:hypothetical protein